FETGHRDAAGDLPAVTRPERAHILQARRHPKRIEMAVIVIRRAVRAMRRDVELVRAVDEIERVDGESHLPGSGHLRVSRAFDVSVCSVAGHAFGVEDRDAEHDVVRRPRSAYVEYELHAITRLKDMSGLTVRTYQPYARNLNLTGAPSALIGF